MKLSELEGQRLAGRFQLGKLLGQGGYGAVFEAEQVSMGRRCAVKVMAPHRVSSRETVKRFELEARSTSRLNHPNTVIVYDFGRDTETDLLFLAMEFLEGVDLNRRINERGPMTVSEAVHVVNQMAGSLQDAHEQGLVHRDIKPQNVMITTRGSDPLFVKVIDFGITKALKATNDAKTGLGLTETGMVLGTPQYMSPEQLRSNQIDGRSDQYSVAISVYRMLTGRTPFGGESAVDVALKHITEMPLPLRTYRPSLEVPTSFERVLLKALSKERDERFPSMVEFARALAESADFDGTVVPSASPAADESWSGKPTEMMQVEDSQALAPMPSDEHTTQDDLPGATMVVSAFDGPSPPDDAADETVATRPEPFKKIDTVRLGEVGGDTAGVSIAAPEESSGGTAAVPRVEPGPVGRPPHEQSSGPRKALVALVGVAFVVLVVAIGAAVIVSGDGPAEEPAVAGPVQTGSEPSDETLTGRDPGPEATDEEPATFDFVEESELETTEDEPPKAADKTGGEKVKETPVSARDEEPTRSPDTAADAVDAAAKKGDEVVTADKVEPGTARVFVVPWGTLYINGRRHGDKPRQSIRLEPGNYKFELRQDGEVKDSKRARVSSGRSVTVQLNAN